MRPTFPVPVVRAGANCGPNLVFTAVRPHQVAGKLTALGLPPDATRYGYRPLHQQPIFTRYATPGCPNAEALVTSTFQLPVHPGLSEAAIEWMAAHLAAIAREGTA